LAHARERAREERPSRARRLAADVGDLGGLETVAPAQERDAAVGLVELLDRGADAARLLVLAGLVGLASRLLERRDAQRVRAARAGAVRAAHRHLEDADEPRRH